ncbi:hypothetical protein HUJ04_005342 [Dendroctonus ponderosae]|nr:hypothetical protein HUJ04_005342 [Dendroctonus ponderosae]
MILTPIIKSDKKQILQDAYEKLQYIQVELLVLNQNYDESIDEVDTLYVDILANINECLRKTTLSNLANPNNITSPTVPQNIFSAVIDKKSAFKGCRKTILFEKLFKGRSAEFN